MWRPRKAAAFLPLCALVRSRHSRRFSATSRRPTVICVGRSDLIGTGFRTGSRVGLGDAPRRPAAGFRTHALVAIASAAAVMVHKAPAFAPGLFPSDAELDPTRLAQG